MALAVFILAHKSPQQVSRLFRAVYHPEDLFILHFDQRAEAALHELGEQLLAQHPNVVVLPSRSILWGGAEMAAVQIEAMRVALQRRDVPWHHFVNLTGQDFPIKPRSYIVARLAQDPEANYISWFDPILTPMWSNARERMERYYIEWPWLDRVLKQRFFGRRIRSLFGWKNRIPHLPAYRRRWPSFFRYFGGANHVVLSRNACAYVTRSPEAKRVVRWLNHSAHANEIIFQSVLLNSPLADTVVNTNLREIVFPLHAPHPRTLVASDFELLTNSDRLWARKFDDKVDSEILDRLEEHLAAEQAAASLYH